MPGKIEKHLVILERRERQRRHSPCRRNGDVVKVPKQSLLKKNRVNWRIRHSPAQSVDVTTRQGGNERAVGDAESLGRKIFVDAIENRPEHWIEHGIFVRRLKRNLGVLGESF